MSHDQADKILGVFIAPDGNTSAERGYLRGHSERLAELTRTGLLPRRLAWQSFQTTILRSLSYPLAATTLSEEDCRFIMAPAKSAALSCSGVVKTCVRDLAHGPVEAFGIGVPNLYNQQGLEPILRLVGLFSRKDDITGGLLRQSYQLLTVELGPHGLPFSHLFSVWGHLATPCWHVHTWQFLSANDIELDLHSPTLDLRREHDDFLAALLFPGKSTSVQFNWP